MMPMGVAVVCIFAGVLLLVMLLRTIFRYRGKREMSCVASWQALHKDESPVKLMMSIVGSLFDKLLTLTVIVLLIAVLYMQFSGERYVLFGYQPTQVVSGSMEPYLKTGALTMTKRIYSLDEIEVGDVIVYKGDALRPDLTDERVIHRVIEIKDGLVYTKGDHNQMADGVGLTMNDIEAKLVWHWNWCSKIYDLMHRSQ